MVNMAEKRSVKEHAIELLQGDQTLSLAGVGRQLNVSREYIRQVADDIPRASRHRIKHCSTCGMRIHLRSGYHAYRMGFCPKCWIPEKERRWLERFLKSHTLFNCEMCGEEFFRENSDVRGVQKDNRSNIRFCSYSCRTRWLWSHNGFGRK